jgi:hypothetical protein
MVMAISYCSNARSENSTNVLTLALYADAHRMGPPPRMAELDATPRFIDFFDAHKALRATHLVVDRPKLVSVLIARAYERVAITARK